MEIHTGYNLGAEMVTCYNRYFGHSETGLHEDIDAMKITNMKIKILSDFMNKLSHGKVDFSNDEIAKKLAYLIDLCDPTILEGKIHRLAEGRTLDQVLSEMINQFRSEGIPDAEITVPMILGKINVDDIYVDALSEKEAEVISQAVDAALKLKSTDINELMMKIGNKYEERTQVIENGRQVLKQSSDHMESINRKMARA